MFGKFWEVFWKISKIIPEIFNKYSGGEKIFKPGPREKIWK